MCRGVSPATPLSELSSGVHVRTRGRLPHWETGEGTYFVTFRLADSLPLDVIVETAAAKAGRIGTYLDWPALEKKLDEGRGRCFLRHPAVAAVVASAIRHLDGTFYDLIAWAVMPNHVHLVVRLRSGHELCAAMHSLKSYTAKAANRILGRSGTFWQREYHDRLLRANEYDGAIAYVLANPRRAGLTNWPWVGSS